MPATSLRFFTTSRGAFALLATAAILGLILWFAGPSTILEVLGSFGWDGTALLLLIYLMVQGLRTLRVWVALPGRERPGLHVLFGIINIHQFLNHMIPARLGEAGFPLLLKRFGHTALAPGVSLLIRIRFQELIILASLFLLAFWWVLLARTEQSGMAGLVAAAVVLALLVTAFWLILPAALRGLAGRFKTSAHKFPRHQDRLIKAASFLQDLASHLHARSRRGPEAVGWVLNLLVWLLLFVFFQQVIRLAGVELGYLETVAGATLASFSQLLPVNTLGSFGALEAGWTLGFVFLGVDPAIALASGFAMHLVLVLFLAGAGAVSWIGLNAGRRHPHPGRT